LNAHFLPVATKFALIERKKLQKILLKSAFD